jgi:predicted benzoate:H+ symporter BenE
LNAGDEGAAVTNLLKPPEGPVAAFFRIAGMMALAIGGPSLGVVLADGDWRDVGSRLPLFLMVLASLAAFFGLLAAIWALVRRWAYNKVTTKDDAW